MEGHAAAEAPGDRWLTRGVAGIGGASLLSDLGHEVPTALLPSFLISTLRAPAAALGLIEGIADGCAGIADSPAARSLMTRLGVRWPVGASERRAGLAPASVNANSVTSM